MEIDHGRDTSCTGGADHPQGGAARVGAGAGMELAGLMEDYALTVAREAHKLATHAGRRTVTAHDIRMAGEILK